MSVTTYGWLVLALPARRRDPDRADLQAAAAARARRARHARDLPLVPERASGCSWRSRTAARRSARSSRVAWDYANTVGVDAQISILIDPLSTLMCLVVAGVSTLIHLYSVAYMGGDRGYSRFFAYLNFFVFSMLLLVLAANFFLLIVGWAFVGAASYFLISFWYRRKTATDGRHQGVRDQRGRRRRARARHLLRLPGHRHAGLPARRSRRSTRGVHGQRAGARRGLHPAARRRVREVAPRSRCTPGSRTPWRARRRSPR